MLEASFEPRKPLLDVQELSKNIENDEICLRPPIDNWARKRVKTEKEFAELLICNPLNTDSNDRLGVHLFHSLKLKVSTRKLKPNDNFHCSDIPEKIEKLKHTYYRAQSHDQRINISEFLPEPIQLIDRGIIRASKDDKFVNEMKKKKMNIDAVMKELAKRRRTKSVTEEQTIQYKEKELRMIRDRRVKYTTDYSGAPIIIKEQNQRENYRNTSALQYYKLISEEKKSNRKANKTVDIQSKTTRMFTNLERENLSYKDNMKAETCNDILNDINMQFNERRKNNLLIGEIKGCILILRKFLGNPSPSTSDISDAQINTSKCLRFLKRFHERTHFIGIVQEIDSIIDAGKLVWEKYGISVLPSKLELDPIGYSQITPKISDVSLTKEIAISESFRKQRHLSVKKYAR